VVLAIRNPTKAASVLDPRCVSLSASKRKGTGWWYWTTSDEKRGTMINWSKAMRNWVKRTMIGLATGTVTLGLLAWLIELLENRVPYIILGPEG